MLSARGGHISDAGFEPARCGNLLRYKLGEPGLPDASARASLTIIPAERHHAEELAANLRDADRAEGLAMGLDPAAEAVASWEATRWPLAGVTDAGVVALFGVIDGGGLLAPTHHPWLLSTHLAERHRVGFARAARLVVDGWRAKYRRLENTVDARYTRSVNLIRWLGFTLSEPFPTLPYGIPFRRFHWTA